MGLANTEAIGGYMLTDALNPRQLSEAAGLDYELTTAVYALYAAENDNLGNLANLDEYQVPLLDLLLFLCDKADSGAVTLDSAMQEELDTIHSQLRMAQDQLQGAAYDRLVVALALPEEGEETFAFLQTLHDEAARFYGPDAVLLVGNSTSDYDLATTFAQDNILISVLSAVFVVIVLLFTFQSAGLPLLLILVIQGSIWLNFSVPALTGDYVFFMSYLIVTAIQMGANIDYAIVVSTRYRDCKAQMPPKSAVVEALNLAFPTILTSGSILTAAAFLIGCITTQPYHCRHRRMPVPRHPALAVPGPVHSAADPGAGGLHRRAYPLRSATAHAPQAGDPRCRTGGRPGAGIRSRVCGRHPARHHPRRRHLAGGCRKDGHTATQNRPSARTAAHAKP